MNLKFFVSSNCEALRGVMQSPLKVYHNSPRVSIQDDAVLSAESITELSTSSLRSRHRPNHRESQHSRSMSEIREEKRSFFHLAVEKNTSKKKNQIPQLQPFPGAPSSVLFLQKEKHRQKTTHPFCPLRDLCCTRCIPMEAPVLQGGSRVSLVQSSAGLSNANGSILSAKGSTIYGLCSVFSVKKQAFQTHLLFQLYCRV